MKINRQFKLNIFIVIFLLIFFIVFFNIIYLNIMDTEKKKLDEMVMIIQENLDSIKQGTMLLPASIEAIIIYKTDNFDDKYIIARPGFNPDDINKYRNVQTVQISSISSIMIIHKNSTPIYEFYLIVTSAVIVIFLLSLLVYLIMIYLNRKREIAVIINQIEHTDSGTLRNILDYDEDLLVILKIFDNYSADFNRKLSMYKSRIEELERENSSLRNKDVLKTGIIENVSHELRSPLTKIKGYLDYIYSGKMGNINEGQRSGLQVARRNVDVLLKQIEQILNYAKDETFALEKELFSLKKLIIDVINVYEHDFNENGINLNINIDNLKTPVYGNRIALYEVYNNILNNALKFTNKNGNIDIIAYEKKIDKINHAVVKITDTGVGVPPGKLDRIFERFYQVDQDENRKYPGIGLGLTIAKNIIAEHRGEIVVSSIIGRGSSFTISIPIMPKEG